MANVGVVGAGLVGSFICHTLIKNGHDVTVFDNDEERLELLKDKAQIHCMDATREHPALSVDADVWVNALPGGLGATLRPEWISGGHSVVDLAFTREDAREMDDLARKHNSRFVLDAGIAPGLSNLIMAQSHALLGRLNSGIIRVGGIPLVPDSGWSYMAPFSPADVVDEYERDVRIISDGRVTTVKPLTKRHYIDFKHETDGVLGELEGFLTDGLRSLIDNVDCDVLEEYTLRWPGHIQRFIDLQEAGELDGMRRRETISRLLADWKFNPRRSECTILQVSVSSDLDQHFWTVFDTGSEEHSSMARTTGLVSVGFVEEMLAGTIPSGVHAPEKLIETGILERIYMMMQLEGISIKRSF